MRFQQLAGGLLALAICFFAVDFSAALRESRPAATPAPSRPLAPESGEQTSTPAPITLPRLVGTLAGSGHALAVLQTGEETTVVSVGQDVAGLRLVEVSKRSAVLEDREQHRYSLTLESATASPTPAPVSQRQIRAMLEHSQDWIGKLTLQPVPDGGVQIGFADEHNPLALLGLRNGDVVTSFAGKPLQGTEDLAAVIAEAGNRTEFDLTVRREGRVVALSLHLAE